MTNTWQRLPIRVLPVILAVALLASCGSDSDPTKPPATGITVSFRPTSTNLDLTVGEGADLWVDVNGTESYTVAWRYGLQEADTDLFHMLADRVGVDTVRATVVTPDREHSQEWHVDVSPDLSSLPREVTGLTLAHGAGPGEASVSWLRTAETVNPLVGYDIAFSYDGPINNGNWDQAAVVVHVPYAGLPVRPDTTLSSVEHGLLPGERAWFAVRALDDLGQRSLIRESLPWDVTYPWRLDVRVQDDAGRPRPGVIVIYGDTGERAATDAAGICNLGPFRDIDLVPLTTRAGDTYYNYTVPPRGVDDGPVLITLVERYELDLVDCTVGTPATTFMSYLQHMTKTDTELAHRPNRELYRWREYPIRVHFARWDTLGVELADSVRLAMEIWNDQLGFEIMEETLDEGAADVRCIFKEMAGTLAGRVWSVDTQDYLEEAIPNVFEVWLDPEYFFPNDEFRPLVATEVALHEFGHVLGLYNHYCSSGKGNLMDNGGAFGSLGDGPANAIKLTELRAVQSITNMAQGVDMAGYEND